MEYLLSPRPRGEADGVFRAWGLEGRLAVLGGAGQASPITSLPRFPWSSGPLRVAGP